MKGYQRFSRRRPRHITAILIVAALIAFAGFCAWMFWRTAMTP